MTIWAVVPVKPLNRAKSRLKDVLSPEQREHLAFEMLRHNLSILTTVSDIDGVLVISRDTKALAEARNFDRVQTLQESGTPELNTALQRASRMLIAWGAEASLILPSDIPLMNKTDIETILSKGQTYHSLVISPDRHRDGTNAVFMRPPALIPFGFGRGSFDHHLASAREHGYPIHIYESERLSIDVDTPDDLDLYVKTARKLGQSILLEGEFHHG